MGRLIRNMLKGAASIFSITPATKRRSPTKKRYNPHKTTSAAMSSDWARVGDSFRVSLERAAHGEK